MGTNEKWPPKISFFCGHMVWLLLTVYGNYMITILSYSEVKTPSIAPDIGFSQAQITSDYLKMVAGEGEANGVSADFISFALLKKLV